jgi:hypothetical protein
VNAVPKSRVANQNHVTIKCGVQAIIMFRTGRRGEFRGETKDACRFSNLVLFTVSHVAIPKFVEQGLLVMNIFFLKKKIKVENHARPARKQVLSSLWPKTIVVWPQNRINIIWSNKSRN